MRQTEALVCVDPDKLPQLWPHVSHFIEAAFASGLGDEDAQSLKADLDKREALLWVVWDGEHLIAAAVTRIVRTATKRVCILVAGGGRELWRWKHFIVDLEEYAKAEGCDAMRVMGRHGWKAIFPEYREPWICLEKGLKD